MLWTCVRFPYRSFPEHHQLKIPMLCITTMNSIPICFDYRVEVCMLWMPELAIQMIWQNTHDLIENNIIDGLRRYPSFGLKCWSCTVRRGGIRSSASLPFNTSEMIDLEIGTHKTSRAIDALQEPVDFLSGAVTRQRSIQLVRKALKA